MAELTSGKYLSATGFKKLRDRIQRQMYERQRLAQDRNIIGAFLYDRFKIAFKEGIWALPRAAQRAACSLLLRIGIVNRSYLVFIKLGRPQIVLSGPFRGMRFSPIPTGGEFMPKILGSYELELHPTIKTIADKKYDLIIDIGSAEGYYAVGLAWLLRPSRVISYDCNPHAERLLRDNAKLNGVNGLVTCKRWCTTVDLEDQLRSSRSSLLICDCEGGEKELLDASLVPSLKQAAIIVEIHDDKPDGPIGLTLRKRFNPTHEIRQILSRTRILEDIPNGLLLDTDEALDSLCEGRKSITTWLFMRPKSSNEHPANL